MSISIAQVDETNLDAAAEVHTIGWRVSHEEICTPEFVATHTTATQRDYLRQKLKGGSRIFLLTDGIPLGLVSVTENRIGDLYVVPDRQGQGYGTLLLQHAIRECSGTPTLWILETNRRAARFYEHRGFCPTGEVNRTSGPLAEIAYAFPTDGKKIEFRDATIEDAELLMKLYNASFYSDYLRYGACPGYGKTKAMMEESIRKDPKHVILCDHEPVGCVSCKMLEHGVYEIGCLCIVPAFQHKGIGTQAMQFIKTSYADWKRLTLVTPIDKRENVAFYTEKCGFTLVSTERDGNVELGQFDLDR